MFSFQLTNLANQAFGQFEVLLDVEELPETAAEGGGLPCVGVQQVGAHLGQYSGDILPLLAGGEPGGSGVVAVERVGRGLVRVLAALVIPALHYSALSNYLSRLALRVRLYTRSLYQIQNCDAERI